MEEGREGKGKEERRGEIKREEENKVEDIGISPVPASHTTSFTLSLLTKTPII